MLKFFGKKQVLLATLVVALALAVYLNYYFAAQGPQTPANTSSVSSNLGDAQFVGNPSTVSGDENPDDYFVQARLNRANARQEALDVIKEMMNDVKATDEIRQQAAEKAELLAKTIEQESKIESLIKAKGFTDCVVFIEDAGCYVVVRCEKLEQSQTVQITEIITTQSDITPQNINLVGVK